jgi:hypothetical protein
MLVENSAGNIGQFPSLATVPTDNQSIELPLNIGTLEGQSEGNDFTKYARCGFQKFWKNSFRD